MFEDPRDSAFFCTWDFYVSDPYPNSGFLSPEFEILIPGIRDFAPSQIFAGIPGNFNKSQVFKIL